MVCVADVKHQCLSAKFCWLPVFRFYWLLLQMLTAARLTRLVLNVWCYLLRRTYSSTQLFRGFTIAVLHLQSFNSLLITELGPSIKGCLHGFDHHAKSEIKLVECISKFGKSVWNTACFFVQKNAFYSAKNKCGGPIWMTPNIKWTPEMLGNLKTLPHLKQQVRCVNLFIDVSGCALSWQGFCNEIHQ